MKIYLFKKENDEEIYYKVDETEDEYVLNFEKIKELSKGILDNIDSENEFNIEVNVQDSSLDIYKTTLENVFKSIKEDEELQQLYKENQSDIENEENDDEKLDVEEIFKSIKDEENE